MENQKEYWSVLGVLFYLVNNSTPDIANMTRELSKANDDANYAAFAELLYVI